MLTIDTNFKSATRTIDNSQKQIIQVKQI
jgi:hypothetical protein